jgi:hypothetical protein
VRGEPFDQHGEVVADDPLGNERVRFDMPGCRAIQERLGPQGYPLQGRTLLEDCGMIGGPVSWVASAVMLLAIFR